jgi:hypothetical protein
MLRLRKILVDESCVCVPMVDFDVLGVEILKVDLLPALKVAAEEAVWRYWGRRQS